MNKNSSKFFKVKSTSSEKYIRVTVTVNSRGDTIVRERTMYNTPVRDDYQLNSSVLKRVTHINVYDPKDPIQITGGNASIMMQKFEPSILDAIGEYGSAGRTFKNATNIKVNNPQGLFGDFHNSLNRTQDRIYK